jgi:glycerate-2-kinase
MIISNFKKLVKTPFRKKALLIAEAGYEAIGIGRVVNKKIKIRNNQLLIIATARGGAKINLNNYKRVFIVGIGKGSALSSLVLAKILGKKLTAGIVLDKNKPSLEIRNLKLEIFKGSHPLPSKQNVLATKEIIKLASGLNEKDLLITFICGGGSALLCGSEKELKASQPVFKELTKRGASIIELNTVRKHISEVKGGGLAKIAYPATVVSLVVSDVLGNDISMVASGPTVYDKTTKKDAKKIIKKYDLQQTTNYLQFTETPKDKKYFKKVKNILFISNKDAVLAMAEKAKKLGLKPKIYSLMLKGEAKKALLPLVETVKNGEVILAAGETTVKFKNQELGIKNYGKGGRNMESVLGALNLIPDSYFIIHNSVVLSFASDGHDNTEAAGAIGDYLTIQKAKKLKLYPQKYLENHNSFHFFEKTGDLLFAKPKSFNISDLMLVIREK